MKTKIIGNRVLVSSTLTKNEIQGLQRHNPDALAKKNLKEEVIFRVGFSSTPSINRNGIAFNEHDPESGKVFLGFDLPNLPEETDNKAAFIAENFGVALTSLKEIEEQAEIAALELAEKLHDIAETITVISAV